MFTAGKVEVFHCYHMAKMELLAVKTTTPISGNRKCQGFTLIELLLVCFLLVLVTSLATSFMAGSNQNNFSTNIRQVTTQLNHSRRQAIITGAEQKVILTTQNTDQETLEASLESFPQGLIESMKLRYSESLDEPLEEVNELVVTFFPMGSSTGGLVELSENEKEVFIFISALTGKLIVETELDVIEAQVQGSLP